MEARQDHPRVCGEKLDRLSMMCSPPGSPPRVRGEAENTVFEEPEAGITPACAGRSGRTGARFSSTWDHPRVCGEKASASALAGVLSGSPPRVRGEATWLLYHDQPERITPACAGRSR